MRPPLSVLLCKVYCFVLWGSHRNISFKLVDDPTYFVSYISLNKISVNPRAPPLRLSLTFSSCWSLPLANSLLVATWYHLSRLHAELFQHFATRQHRFSDSKTYLGRSHAILAKVAIFTQTLHVFHVSSVRSCACMLIERWMEIDQGMSLQPLKIL